MVEYQNSVPYELIELNEIIEKSLKKHDKELENGLWFDKVSRKLQKKLNKESIDLHEVLSENYYFSG